MFIQVTSVSLNLRKTGEVIFRCLVAKLCLTLLQPHGL